MVRQKRPFQLDGRLQLCASMLRCGRTVADIGTDHAYLPVWLALNGRVPHAIAADVREGPLQAARRTIEKYNVASVVETRLSDGLDQIGPEEADDIVLAGMGGQLIAELLGRAPWCRNPEKNLVLQPMTAAQELRMAFRGAGFRLCVEKAVFSFGRVYSVMQVRFGLQEADAAAEALYPYIGRLTPDTKENRAYMERCVRDLCNRRNGALHRGAQAEAQALQEIMVRIEKLLQKRGDGYGDSTENI